MKSLGQLIERYRKQANISQKQLAAKIGVTPNSVSLYESDKREPGVDVLRKIAIALRITGDELFGLDRSDITALNDYECDLLRRIRKLNKTGQDRLLEYSSFLEKSPEHSNTKK